MPYEHIEAKFVAWAKNEPNIRAALLVGSRARNHKPADEWSDLDLILFTTTPDAYFVNSEWLSQMGEIWLCIENEALESSPEWLVLYRGGYKVDYLIAPATAPLSELVKIPIYEPMLRRGFRVLFDKDESEADKAPLDFATRCYGQPSPQAFLNIISRLMLFSERAAKILTRGELWRAKFLCDIQLKEYLLILLEWHACAVYGESLDTWRNGRFLHEWIHPHAAQALPATFAHYELDDMWRAVLATLELGCWLGRETAVLWQYDYPQQAEQEITAWIQQLHQQATAAPPTPLLNPNDRG